MNFVIAIPSYQRAKKLRDKTLKYLQEQGVPKESILIFVVGEEYQEYLEVLDPDTYGQLILGVHTLVGQRQFIQSYIPADRWILFMDDDIKQIKFLTPMPLIDFVNRMFEICAEENLRLWSIQPANNLFFCREKIQIGKQFCVGCFYGLINLPQVYPTVSACEDKWRSLYFYKLNGSTMRYLGACPDTTYFTKGGLSDYRKSKQHSDTLAVINMFPEECELKIKKNGISECYWRNIVLKERLLIQSLPGIPELPLEGAGLVSWGVPLEQEIAQ